MLGDSCFNSCWEWGSPDRGKGSGQGQSEAGMVRFSNYISKAQEGRNLSEDF